MSRSRIGFTSRHSERVRTKKTNGHHLTGDARSYFNSLFLNGYRSTCPVVAQETVESVIV